MIYVGGDIVPIDDRNPTAEAMAIKAGKIVAVGKKDLLLRLKGNDTKVKDLGGCCLLPGFIDGHGHCFVTGLQAASANLLAPPDHNVKDIAGIASVESI